MRKLIVILLILASLWGLGAALSSAPKTHPHPALELRHEERVIARGCEAARALGEVNTEFYAAACE